MNAILPFPTPNHQADIDQLADRITLLAGQINAANHRLLKLIAQFDECKGWSGGGTVRSCAHWLNWRCGIALGAAREKVRVANCLSELPLIDAAFASGALSYSKVRAMTRVATPENEDYLLMIAAHGTASHMEKLVRRYEQVQTRMNRDTERSQQAERKLVYYRDDDGMWVIHARLAPEAGEQVIKALEAVVRPIQEQRQRETLQARDEESSGEISAETFAQTVEREEIQEQGHNAGFQELLEHTRADALVAITEHFLATASSMSASPLSNGSPALQALKGSERCQIVLHVDINTLRQQQESQQKADHRAEQCCHLEHGQWLVPATARRLSCDASLVTVLEDEAGNPLNVGRRSRTVPPAIRRALAQRDTSCRFPGCCESRYVDAHHIQHWADGGETRLDNLVTLCRYHHRLLHRGSFTITVAGSHKTDHNPKLVFTTPAGRVLSESLYPQFPKISAETCARSLRRHAPAVTAKTCTPHWEGERCDYGMAVDGLLRRDAAASYPA